MGGSKKCQIGVGGLPEKQEAQYHDCNARHGGQNGYMLIGILSEGGHRLMVKN